MDLSTLGTYYYHMPYYEEKPCVYIKSRWEDHRRRLYNQNMLVKVIEKGRRDAELQSEALKKVSDRHQNVSKEEGMNDVQEMITMERPHPERRLRGVLEELSVGCNRFCSLAMGSSELVYLEVSRCSRFCSLLQKASGKDGNSAGRTKLDKERARTLLREVEIIGKEAKKMKATVRASTYKEKLKQTASFVNKLKVLNIEPQDSLPDIFIWMLSNNKRIAYTRFPSRDILYSIVAEETGVNCGKVQTLFLKLPGKRGTGPSGWTIQAKLQLYLWLGLNKHKKDFLGGLPKGYEQTKAIQSAGRLQSVPPVTLKYEERQTFQLRAHMYQARSLVASDASERQTFQLRAHMYQARSLVASDVSERQTFQLRAHMYQARSLVASDASGLSDPFARVVFSTRSMKTEVISETLAPTWDQLLVFDDLTLFGNPKSMAEEPPTIVVEIFDQDTVDTSKQVVGLPARLSLPAKHPTAN
ncbi:synaptic vesicle exocytosis [Branchiostoma belcheri]|nr:synaptic vesicle exocytosis [Branchiostoma belcheri]